MSKCEDEFHRDGIGKLVLKNGCHKEVSWETEFYREGIVSAGIIRGDVEHLRTAANDRCAILKLDDDVIVAISIDLLNDGEASFEPLLISTAPPTFCAQTISASGGFFGGARYAIDFSDARGGSFRVILPAIIVWDFLPAALSQLSPVFLAEETTTSFCRIVENVNTAAPSDSCFVHITFDTDQSLAMTPSKARQLAEELKKLAQKVEGRPIH